jgi:hypothetical protein
VRNYEGSFSGVQSGWQYHEVAGQFGAGLEASGHQVQYINITAPRIFLLKTVSTKR